jgi:hypothetical protein
VKNYTSQNVSSPEVRDLFGTAVSRGRKPLVFTVTALTPDTSSFANSNSVAVVHFKVQEASLLGLNDDGAGFLCAGRDGAQPSSVLLRDLRDCCLGRTPKAAERNLNGIEGCGFEPLPQESPPLSKKPLISQGFKAGG